MHLKQLARYLEMTQSKSIHTLFALLLSLTVAVSLGFGATIAYASPAGSFDVTGDGDFSYADGSLTISGGSVTVSMADDADTTSDRIVIAGDATVTLSDVAISAASGQALKVNPGVTATVLLSGENSLTGGNGHAAVEPAWEKSGDTVTMASLTIGGSGSLTATGGSNSAGIGGSKSVNGVYGNITIADDAGTINAYGSGGAAGIGSSDNPANGTSSGSYKYITDRWGTITINGGTITASAPRQGAGIGGGNHSDSGEIVINGGTVSADGHTGIGCGYGSSKPDNSGKKGPGYYFADVTITGGNVTATAHDGGFTNDSGAGIGGGEYSDAKVTISGGTVHAYGGDASSSYHHGGAGIGGGYMGHSEVTITGGTVVAEGGDAAAGIGSGATPNNNPNRGSSKRSGETTYEGTVVTISGGDVTATGGPKGGAGIGGGVGADTVSVSISGGAVKAYGAASSSEDMKGGAGIGSGYSGISSGEDPKYFVESDTSVSITGGDVVAIGGWGAAGIGSGAENKMADTIDIDVTNATLEAYSDGTKFAIDTRILNEDGSTTSRTDGRSITGDVLQGTFVHAGQIGGYEQDPEGLSSIIVTNDATSKSKDLTNMPDGYRSFATSVDSAGSYTVYTDDSDIGNGEGRYFSLCSRDEWAEEYVEKVGVKYEVTTDALSDNFYLFPVKSIIVSKSVIADEGLDASAINVTLFFAVQSKTTGEFLMNDDGSIWMESIEVVDGEPQGRAFFSDVVDDSYDIWEMDGNGAKLEEGAAFDAVTVKRIETQHGDSSDNNAQIDDTIWTDRVTVLNTFVPTDQPDEPDDPDNPDTPDEPDKPDTPDTPDKPEVVPEPAPQPEAKPAPLPRTGDESDSPASALLLAMLGAAMMLAARPRRRQD